MSGDGNLRSEGLQFARVYRRLKDSGDIVQSLDRLSHGLDVFIGLAGAEIFCGLGRDDL